MKEGDRCRIVGTFEVLLVPGNFHIGYHSSGHLIQKYMAKIGRRFPVDFSHTISQLQFGKIHTQGEKLRRDFKLKDLNTLNNFRST
jgi:Endoplasmic reticulum vesicle transporter